MPRGKKIDPKELSPEEYEKKFGRRKPGPRPGVARVARAAGTKKDGTPRGKPGPKPGPKPGHARVAAQGTTSDAPWGYKKDGTPRKPPGRKAAGGKKHEAASTPATATEPKRRGPKPGFKRNQATPQVAPTPGRDLGAPPPSRAKNFQFAKSLIAEDFDEQQILELHEDIENRLIGDKTDDFTKDDWAAIAELEASGYSKLGAVKNVLTDRLAERAANEAVTQAIEEETPDDDDVEDETETDVTVSAPSGQNKENPTSQLAHPASTP
jgi:hypothetical protein